MRNLYKSFEPNDKLALILGVIAFVLCCSACRHTPASTIDPSLAYCVPANTTVLAGADLKQLRASSLYGKLSPAMLAVFEPLREASQVVIAYDGKGITIIARGGFHEAPAGSTFIAPGIAISGAPEVVEAAKARYSAKSVAAADLLSRSEAVAASPIWGIALGSATLPLSGNLANLNNFLHSTTYTTVSAALADGASLHLTGYCRTVEQAGHLERTIRAFISLSKLRGNAPGDVRLETSGLSVNVSITLDAAAAASLFR